jgi:hypothetical protein
VSLKAAGSGRCLTDQLADRLDADDLDFANSDVRDELGVAPDHHPARADLQQRYFAGRTDGLRPYTFETLVTARVT